MLEFFTYKKVKKHREDKAEKQKLEKEKENDKGKGKEENPKSDAAKASTDVAHHSESTSSPEITLQRADGMPILDPEDEKFLERLTSPSDSAASNGGGGGDDETPPPLPPRVKTPVIELEDSDASSLASKEENNKQQQEVPTKDGEGKGKGKDKEKHKGKDKDKHDGDHKPKRFSFVTNLSRNMSLKRKPTQHLSVPATSSSPTPSEQELRKEETEIARVLEDLNLAASTDANNNKTFSLSRESAETLRKFTQVLKDLVNGVPTAYNDLVALIEDRDGVLARSYDKLPSSLKKLVAQLPEKLTSSLAPELLAAAAEAQGLKGTSAEGGGGDKLSKGDAVKKLLGANNLLELVTKPGAVVGLLKGIVNALKARWPAFVGTNALWSVAVFLLLSALWYCYKRGRETRLEKEASDAEAAEAERRGKEEELVEGGKEGRGGEVLRIEGGSSDGQQQQQQQQPTVSVSAPAA